MPLQSRIAALAADGAGRTEVDGRAYLVDGALPGEWVEFEPRKRRRGKYRGILKRVIEPSPDRVAPRCEYFGVCGGCAQQHISPDAQLALKEKTLFDHLSRANAEPQRRLPPPPTVIWGYRRKARPGIRYVPQKGGILVGFRERNSSYITSLQHCHTLDARLSALLPGLHHAFEQLSIRAQIPQIEVAAADNAVALVLRHLQALSAADTALLTRFAEDTGVQFFLQPGGLESVAPLWPPAPEPLHYRLDDYDLTLRFAPTDFIQVNPQANAAMLKSALELLAPTPDDRVLDLFCGLGNFTLPIARSGAAVLGVEGDPQLTRRARDNAALNAITCAEFQTLDLHQPLSAADVFAAREFNKVLLDPPRSGAVEVAKRLIPQLAPRVILYISCNPATLARDAAILVHTQNYRLTHAGIVNMFPHTAQVESIARFER